MGGLLTYRVGNYDNTAEREQFRMIADKLKTHVYQKEDIFVFVANFNIGCELDALFIKKDAIISIEFKNYGGKIIANENGEWTSDGIIINGGSRKTVLQQAKINHSIAKREFKALGIKNISHLIIFHKPIELINHLSATSNSWLHVTDDYHFLEKLDDITCPSTNLDAKSILRLIELLNLNPFYLPEFSNVSSNFFMNEENQIQNGDFCTNGLIESDGASVKDNIELHVGPILCTNYSCEQRELVAFVKHELANVLKNIKFKVELYNPASFLSTFVNESLSELNSCVILVKAKNIENYARRLSKFIFRDVKIIESDIIYWEEPIENTIPIELSSNQKRPISDLEPLDVVSSKKCDTVKYRKSKTIMPHWLDKFLFDELDAAYAPKYTKFDYNLDLSRDDVKVYLGTYFPRSYAESFCIFDNLLRNTCFFNRLVSCHEINILDIGCGTGGEIIALVIVLSKFIDIKVKINIYAFDGNDQALIALTSLIENLQFHTHHSINFETQHKIIRNKKYIDTSILRDCRYDFILCTKFVCELLSHHVIKDHAYRTIASSLCPLLSNNGIFLLLDVTTKDETTNLFYPQLMNRELNTYVEESQEFSTLLPIPCSFAKCEDDCFIQQRFYITHSRVNCDESKVCYRLLCRKELKSLISSDFNKHAQYIIYPDKFKDGDDSAICNKIQGEIILDSFNINQ